MKRHTEAAIAGSWVGFSVGIIVNAVIVSRPLTWALAVFFVALEGYAVLNEKKGDTYSEQFYKIPVDIIRWVAGIALALQVILHIHWIVGLLIFAWLPVHFTRRQMWH